MAYLNYDGTTAAETPASVNNIYGTTAGNETLQGTSAAQGLYGQGNGGHAFSDVLTDTERRAIIEYLKTL